MTETNRVDYVVTMYNQHQFASYPWDKEYPYRWRLHPSAPWQQRTRGAVLREMGELLAQGDLVAVNACIKMVQSSDIILEK